MLHTHTHTHTHTQYNRGSLESVNQATHILTHTSCFFKPTRDYRAINFIHHPLIKWFPTWRRRPKRAQPAVVNQGSNPF